MNCYSRLRVVNGLVVHIISTESEVFWPIQWHQLSPIQSVWYFKEWPTCLSIIPFAEVYHPNDVRMAMDLHYYYGDCTTPEAQAQIKQNFIQLLNESFFNQVCQDPALKDKCSAKNVEVTCSWEVSVASRRRRSVGKHSSNNLTIEKKRNVNCVFIDLQKRQSKVELKGRRNTSREQVFPTPFCHLNSYGCA